MRYNKILIFKKNIYMLLTIQYALKISYKKYEYI